MTKDAHGGRKAKAGTSKQPGTIPGARMPAGTGKRRDQWCNGRKDTDAEQRRHILSLLSIQVKLGSRWWGDVWGENFISSGRCLLSEHSAPASPTKGTYGWRRGCRLGCWSSLACVFKMVQVMLISFLFLESHGSVKLIEARPCLPLVI